MSSRVRRERSFAQIAADIWASHLSGVTHSHFAKPGLLAATSCSRLLKYPTCAFGAGFKGAFDRDSYLFGMESVSLRVASIRARVCALTSASHAS
jgi:hypothetical protein